MAGSIIVPKEVLYRDWYKCPVVSRLYFHLLFEASYSENTTTKFELKRGQVLTSISRLKTELNISTQKLRTGFSKLEKLGLIKKEVLKKQSLITINDYEDYQSYSKF